jgi:hypothetical protein
VIQCGMEVMEEASEEVSGDCGVALAKATAYFRSLRWLVLPEDQLPETALVFP